MMTKETRDKLDKVENRLFNLAYRMQIPSDDTIYGYGSAMRDSSLQEILIRLEELYQFLGIERQRTPSMIRLVKKSPPVSKTN